LISSGPQPTDIFADGKMM